MKKALILITTVISVSICNAQFGGSLSYSTRNVLSVDGFYGKKKNRVHFGYGHQFNGQKNSVVSTRKTNYGLTKIEDGNYFWHIDIGYSRIILQKLTLNPMLSFGVKNYFTNYKDDRFSDSGYSLINRSESDIGLGINVGYLLNKNVEPFIGYHSLKNANFGIRVIF